MTFMRMLPSAALVAAVAAVLAVNTAASDARPDTGLPIVSPSDNQQCTLYDVQCSPNSTFAPSWCMYQNPLIVPRPPVALVNHSAAMAGYAPRYACRFDHGKHYGQAFQQCQLITNFQATQLTPVGSNETRRLIVVATRSTNSSKEPMSELNIMDDNFQSVYQPFGEGNAFPGLLSMLVVIDQRSMPDTHKVIAFGGNVNSMRGRHSASVGFIVFSMDRDGVHKENLAYCFVPGVNVLMGSFLYPSQYSDSTLLFASVIVNITTSHLHVPFVEMDPSQTVETFNSSCTPALQWEVDPAAADGDHPIAQLETLYHYTNCSAAASFNYSFGGFFNAENCVEVPLVVVATQTAVGVYAYQGEAQMVHPSAHPGAWFYNMSSPTDGRITGVSVFGQQVPPAAATNMTLSADMAPVSQRLWMVVTITSPKESQVLWLDMPEFAVVDTDEPISQENPSGRSLDHAKTCGPNSYYAAATDTSPSRCVSRVHVAASNSTFTFTKVDVRWRGVPEADKAQLSKANCAPFDMACLEQYAKRTQSGAKSAFQPMEEELSKSLTSGNGGVVSEYFSSQYGLRWAFFIATTARTMEVYHALPVPSNCAKEDDQSLLVSRANTLSLMGDITQYSVTHNGQFVFSAVSRGKWALKSMERLVQVCAYLQDNPNDPFLDKWRSACHGDPAPRLPAVPDFLQIASSCLPGTHCPSFKDEVVQEVPEGFYSTFFFDLNKCEPGYMCMAGRRSKCPTGFTCPGYGTTIPTKCPVDPTLSTTCYTEGLAQPQICPNGTLCGVPYLPPIPVPPGAIQVFDHIDATPAVPAHVVRGLRSCPSGYWCNLGMYSMLPMTQKKCPADFFCSQPSVMRPTLCNMNGLCTKDNCTGNAPYCPAGQTKQRKCPPGHFCMRPNELGNCSAGSYCPAGSAVWGLCPARYYCSVDGSTKTQCPDGYYCPQGVTEPNKCNFMSSCSCSGGCKSPDNFVSVPVLVLLPILFYLSWKVAKWYIKKKWAKRDAALDERRRHHRSGGSQRAAAVKARRRLQVKQGAGAGAGAGAGVDVELLASPKQLDAHLLSDDLMGDYDDDDGGLTVKDFTIDFHFENLGLVLKKAPHAVVMKGVTGAVLHGRVTAVMGPSGAGKSTFLTTLAAKATYGNQTGVIRINGNEVPLSQYSKLVGFVPQEDVMMRDMTVEENLRYCAETRLPASWSSDRKMLFVDEVMSLLGLREIRHSQIGDERKRGISGGQRKRVNIGMEMCADPTVLLLDEPTSGLDSTSSMEVCTALRQIAELGLCVVTVIHQPRYEIFTAFHDVLLLGKGGRTVYLGPSDQALPYFESLGFHPPNRCNPADFFMDVIGGEFPADFREAHPDFTPKDLFTKWEEHLRANTIPEFTPPPPHAPTVAEKIAMGRQTAGLPALVFQSFKRSMWQHARSKVAVAVDLGLVFVASVTLAAVYWGEALYKPPEPSEVFATCPAKVGKECQLCLSVVSDQILSRGSMTCIAMSLCAVASMIRVFGSERVEYWREASGLSQPWHTIGYFIGKDLSMLPHMFLAPLIFNIVYLSVTTPRGSFATYYWVMLGLYYTATAFGYIVSVAAPPSLAQLMGVVAVFGCAMFAGGMPTLKILYTKFIPLCWLPWVSYVRYALEALYVGEVINYEDIVELQGVNLAKHLRDTFGYDLYAYSRDVAALFAFGVFLRLVAMVLMIVLDRKKKM